MSDTPPHESDSEVADENSDGDLDEDGLLPVIPKPVKMKAIYKKRAVKKRVGRPKKDTQDQEEEETIDVSSSDDANTNKISDGAEEPPKKKTKMSKKGEPKGKGGKAGAKGKGKSEVKGKGKGKGKGKSILKQGQIPDPKDDK